MRFARKDNCKSVALLKSLIASVFEQAYPSNPLYSGRSFQEHRKGYEVKNTFEKAILLKDITISDLAKQIKELNDIIKQQEFMIARRDVIIRFLATGKADTQGEPIVKV